jgi:hypothetical protein
MPQDLRQFPEDPAARARRDGTVTPLSFQFWQPNSDRLSMSCLMLGTGALAVNSVNLIARGLSMKSACYGMPGAIALCLSSGMVVSDTVGERHIGKAISVAVGVLFSRQLWVMYNRKFMKRHVAASLFWAAAVVHMASADSEARQPGREELHYVRGKGAGNGHVENWKYNVPDEYRKRENDKLLP